MKQVILMRNDLGMSIGKMCAQAAHAVISPKDPVIVLKISSEAVLKTLLDKAFRQGLAHGAVHDAGNTEVPPGTLTCGCIYGVDKLVDKITGQLPLL